MHKPMVCTTKLSSLITLPKRRLYDGPIVRKPLEPVFAEKKHKVHSWSEKAILPSFLE